MVIFPTAYFASIRYIKSILKYSSFEIEKEETFPKQTIRNRCVILSANGSLNLIVPVIHSKVKNEKTNNILIDHSQNWQAKHLQSIKSAYSSAPFFEDYFWKIEKILSQKSESKLIELNTTITSMLLDCIDINLNFKYTEQFHKDSVTRDEDYLNESNLLDKYHQVFNEKFGFVSNLSFLDLLMNEGPLARKFVVS